MSLVTAGLLCHLHSCVRRDTYSQYVRKLQASSQEHSDHPHWTPQRQEGGFPEAGGHWLVTCNWISSPQSSSSTRNTPEICHRHLHKNCFQQQKSPNILLMLTLSSSSCGNPDIRKVGFSTPKKRHMKLQSSVRLIRKLWTCKCYQKSKLFLSSRATCNLCLP